MGWTPGAIADIGAIVDKVIVVEKTNHRGKPVFDKEHEVAMSPHITLMVTVYPVIVGKDQPERLVMSLGG